MLNKPRPHRATRRCSIDNLPVRGRAGGSERCQPPRNNVTDDCRASDMAAVLAEEEEARNFIEEYFRVITAGHVPASASGNQTGADWFGGKTAM